MSKKISEVANVETLEATAKIPISLTSGVAQTATVLLILDLLKSYTVTIMD